MYKCLIIEDDLSICRLLKNFFQDKYHVIISHYAKEGISLYKKENPDFVILDLGLLDMDGKEVIKEIRNNGETPILILSARNEDREKVASLDLGADDYVTKPFSLDELASRLRVIIRRIERSSQTDKTVTFFKNGDLYINYETNEVYIKDTLIHLTPSEFKILKLLADNVGKIITYSQINKTLFGSSIVDQYEMATLRVFVAGLRKKIEENPSLPQYIITHLGTGYHMQYV